MKEFLHDPRVTEALERLNTALDAATGGTLKNLLLVAQTTEATAVSYNGCKCPDCSTNLLTAAGRILSGVEITVEDEDEDEPLDWAAKGQVH